MVVLFVYVCTHTLCYLTPPPRYDARVKAMEIDERPTEQYSDIGGLDKQIQEVHPPALATVRAAGYPPLPHPPTHLAD